MMPELFNGGPYSKASDVYAFGMIMWEISSGEKPFLEIVHDKQLALGIFLHDFRPTITDDTPQFYRDLMQKCWHSDPTQRPSAKEIYKLTWNWLVFKTQIQDKIEEAEEIRQRNMKTKKQSKTQHPGAIYPSRLMTNIVNGKQL